MNAVARHGAASVEKHREWFSDARLGMFIHFGTYALAARHEWVKSREEIGTEEYDKYFANFDPDLYDPREWAARAREAGMKYVVLTTKHHEGFCLWDSKFTDYKVTNTPYGKDLLKPFVDAFRAEGLRVGFYYSLIDWHHPDFGIDAHHPLRNNPDAATINASKDRKTYSTYLHNQVRELLTDFGQIDILWFDFSYEHRIYKGLPGKGPDDWEAEKLIEMIRELQPNVIINNRLGLPLEGNTMPDLLTPEQFTPRVAPTAHGKPVRWEGCHTFGDSWGYFRGEANWKSPEQLIKLLIDGVALGGNLLMNVGPTGRGTFDERANDALGVFAKWMKLHQRSIYGAGEAVGFTAPDGCRFTQRGNRLYLHIYNWPHRHIHLPDMDGRIAYAQFLHDASEVQWLTHEANVDINIGVAVPPGMVTLELPARKPEVTVPVIEFMLK